MPALDLPLDKDPAIYHWPVAGRLVAISGPVAISRLQRLFGALLRNGALSAVGSDTNGATRVASARIVDDMEDIA